MQLSRAAILTLPAEGAARAATGSRMFALPRIRAGGKTLIWSIDSLSRGHYDGVTNAPQAALVSLGYEGRNAGDLIVQLTEQHVTVLVDVRLTPLSRKPGLSKRKLAEVLESAGIRYLHLPHLGNPKDNREAFRAGDPASRARFRQILGTSDGAAALQHVAELLDGGSVALLCFERDHATCHRDLVSAAILKSRPDLPVVNL